MDQGRDACLEIDQQIGNRNQSRRQIENLHIGIEIARGHQSAFVQVGGKNIGILIYGSVLNQIASGLQDLLSPLDTLPEKIDLQV